MEALKNDLFTFSRNGFSGAISLRGFRETHSKGPSSQNQHFGPGSKPRGALGSRLQNPSLGPCYKLASNAHVPDFWLVSKFCKLILTNLLANSRKLPRVYHSMLNADTRFSYQVERGRTIQSQSFFPFKVVFNRLCHKRKHYTFCCGWVDGSYWYERLSFFASLQKGEDTEM